uniref:Putative G-protein coupled receptor Mth-like 4 n=1 Tax=Lygus hesperus TaxID=30085 RepID=A0A146LIG3_LYGHE
MWASPLWILFVAVTGLRGAGSDVVVPLCCPFGQVVGGTELIERTINGTIQHVQTINCNDTSDPFIEEFEPMQNLSSRHHPITCPNMKRAPFRFYKTGNKTFGELVQRFLSTDYGQTLCFDFTDNEVFWHFCLNTTRSSRIRPAGGKPQTPEVCQVKSNRVKWWFTVACGLSIVSLAITAIIYSTVKPLTSNPHSPYIVAHNLSLAMLYVTRISLQVVPISQDVTECRFIAFVLQFFTLASFLWMNAMCLDIHITIRHSLDDEFVDPADDYRRMQPRPMAKSPYNKKFFLLSLYAWGIPLLITGLSMFFEFSDSIASTSPFKPHVARWECSCFFTGKSRWYLFRYPMGVSVVFSVALFIGTAVILYQHERNTAGILENNKYANERRYFFLYLKLFVIMGMSMGLGWAFDTALKKISFITNTTLPSYFSYINFFMDVIYCFQGVFIFILFICKRRTLKILLEQFRFLRFLKCSTGEESGSTTGDQGMTSAASKETIL